MFRAVDETLGAISSSKTALYSINQFLLEKEKEVEKEREKEKKSSESLSGQAFSSSSSPAQKLRKSVLKSDSSKYENRFESGSRGGGGGGGVGGGLGGGDLKGSSNYFDKRKDRSRGGSFSHQVGTTLILYCFASFESN